MIITRWLQLSYSYDQSWQIVDSHRLIIVRCSYDGRATICYFHTIWTHFTLFFTIFMYSISFQNTDFGVLQNTSKHFQISICIPSMERWSFGTPGCNKRFPRFPPKRIIVRCILNGIIRLLPYRTYRLMLVRGYWEQDGSIMIIEAPTPNKK